MKSELCEKKNTIQDDSGFLMYLDEVTFGQIDLRWGHYSNPEEKVLSFRPDKSAIVSHFRIEDSTGPMNGKYQTISEKQFVVYHEPSQSYDLCIAPTKTKTRSFFEMIISDNFFNSMFTEESEFMTHFHNCSSSQTPSFEFTAQIAPAMYSVIHEMQNSTYRGYLKGVHLEAKAIELFLMQISQLDQKKSIRRSTLKPRDIECLHEIKDYMSVHYNESFSIVELAKRGGINQMKLKNGFRELFNTTVFNYLRDLRMEEAKMLLVQGHMNINEVSDKIGYKHPHHFTAAFKKKFGIVPKEIKK